MVKRKAILFTLITLTAIVVTSSVLIINAKDSKADEINLPSFNNTTDYYFSNKYTSLENDIKVNSLYEITSDDTLLTKSDGGKFYVNKNDLSIKFMDTDGFIHNTTINNSKNENGRDVLNYLNYNIARSAINIYYYNTKNNNMTMQLESMNILEDAIDDNIVNYKSKLLSFDIDSDNLGFKALYYFATSKITIPFNVRFNEKSFTVSILNEQIKEESDYKLAAISIYSYFGGVKNNEIDGYNFIPDGTGALIRYKKGSDTTYTNYTKRIYNNDMGISTNDSNNSSIMLPVFGYVHGVNQHGMVSYITKGAEYAAINATLATKNIPFYTIYPQFYYRNTYVQPMSNTGSSISLVQSERESFDIEITYEFLSKENANYIGMANTYKKYLFNNKDENKISDSNIPLRIDSIGLEKTTGTLFNKSIVMTTFKDYSDIINDIHNNNITNTFGVFKGFSNDGVTWSAPLYKNVSSKLKNIYDNAFLDNTYFYMNTLKASEKQGGYSTSKDVSRRINSTFISKSIYDDLKYYLTTSSAIDLLNKNINSLKKKGINNFALDDISYELYSSFNKNKETRTAAKENIINQLSSLNENTILYSANDYALKYTNKNLDYSMFSSQYLAFDDTVPFYSIVASGYVELYSKYINFFSNARDDLLRMIDYNVYPSFLLTKEKASKLEESSLNYIYSSAYDDYKEEVKVYYNFVNDALKNVINSKIINRVVLQDGVVKISYDNNVDIIVNYLNKDVLYNHQTIPYKNYLVLGGNNND